MCSIRFRSSLCVFVAVVGLALPAAAIRLQRDLPFEYGEWAEIEAEDGPLTIHRVSIGRGHPGGKLSRVKQRWASQGDAGHREWVEIVFEYSNRAEQDWNAIVAIQWRDAEGRPIDGFTGKMRLEAEALPGYRKVSLTTLKYGLERAAQLRLRVDYSP